MTAPRRPVAVYDPPPIPGWRAMAWTAYYDALGADASPHGYGATEAEALDDLRDMMEDAHD